MDGWTTCPGCGLKLPQQDGLTDHRVNASPECLRVYAEVAGFASEHPPLMRLHQLTVDAYGAQHGGGTAPPIRLTYSLVGLHLAFDHGLTGDEVRAAHQQMGKPDASWPRLSSPDDLDTITVMAVAEAGVMVNSVPGHEAATQRWAGDVWGACKEQHQAVADLTTRLLPHVVSR